MPDQEIEPTEENALGSRRIIWAILIVVAVVIVSVVVLALLGPYVGQVYTDTLITI